MKQALFGYLLYFVPKNILSYWVGRLVHLRWPRPINLLLMRVFADYYRIDMVEAEKPISEYSSIGDLFTRKLKPGLRPVESGFVHPSDSNLTTLGVIRQGELIQAKGKKYQLSEFLKCEDQGLLSKFEQGHFLTYYLCPTDYHRVHSPVDGKIISCAHVPGRLWPVNPWSVGHISQLFSVNERVVVWIETDAGKVGVVLVGATNVGKMTMSFDDKIVTNQGNWRSTLHCDYREPIEVKRGDELGIFHMGSTVIVVTPKDYLEKIPSLGPHYVKMGQSLSRLL